MLLEPLREYAQEKLITSGEAQTVQHSHALYYMELAESAAAQWDSPTVDAAIEVLEREHDNLRAALQWARDSGDATVGLRIAGALWRFWRGSGATSEGRGWLADLLAAQDSTPDAPSITARLRAMQGAAWLASDQHDFAQAEQLFEQSLELHRSSGETEGETLLLLNAARQARTLGQYQRAAQLIEEALARHRAVGSRASSGSGGMGLSLYTMALVCREQGDFTRAAELYRECADFHREIGDHEGMTSALLGLGDVARDQGEAAGIRKYSTPSLAFYRNLGILWAVGFALNNLAQAALLEGDVQQALALISESADLFRAIANDGGLAEVLVTMGDIVQAQGDMSRAYEVLTEALRLAWVVGPRVLMATAMEKLGAVLIAVGQAASAAQLLSAASALREQMGAPVRPVDACYVERAQEAARLSLGDNAFAALWVQASNQPISEILSVIIDF